MRGLKGKRVAITGANSGIGKATAQRFFEEGAQLILIDREVAPNWRKSYPERTVFQKGDVSREADLNQIGEIFERDGLDTLINNAGIIRDAQLEKMTTTAWDAVLAVNLTAVFRLSQMATTVMRNSAGGVILNAASVVAHYGNFGQANYAAAKAGLIGLTKTLAKELGRFGIRVNAVAPGFIATPMLAGVPEKLLAMAGEKPPLGRLGRAEEVASAYAFLASDDASYITGITLDVNGGLILG